MSPVNRYQDILGVSRLHEVKLTTLGEVVKRNPLSALCSRIANAFRMRTQSGRAEIASRFEKIMAAMGEAATDALTGHVEPSRRQQAAVLETMGRLLKEIGQDDISADDARKSVLNALKKDSAYAALSKEQKNALRDHLNDIVQGDPAHWQSDLMCLAANYRKSPAELKSLMHNTLMQEIDDALQTIIEQAEDPVQSETIAHKLDAADFYKALPEETDASKSRIKTALKDLYEKNSRAAFDAYQSMVTEFRDVDAELSAYLDAVGEQLYAASPKERGSIYYDVIPQLSKMPGYKDLPEVRFCRDGFVRALALLAREGDQPRKPWNTYLSMIEREHPAMLSEVKQFQQEFLDHVAAERQTIADDLSRHIQDTMLYKALPHEEKEKILSSMAMISRSPQHMETWTAVKDRIVSEYEGAKSAAYKERKNLSQRIIDAGRRIAFDIGVQHLKRDSTFDALNDEQKLDLRKALWERLQKNEVLENVQTEVNETLAAYLRPAGEAAQKDADEDVAARLEQASDAPSGPSRRGVAFNPVAEILDDADSGVHGQHPDSSAS